MSNADRRADALRARRAQQDEAPMPAVASDDTAAARAHFMGASVIEGLTQGRAVQALPIDEDLIAIQFSENEDRAESSDMERAWALERMRQLLPDTPWEKIEARFHLSESRRKQLMRLTTFTPEQQRVVARLRASEFQLRPLHTALREGGLELSHADRVFTQLATRVSSPQAVDSEGGKVASTAPRLDHTTVARMVARAQKQLAAAPAVRPRWLAPLQQSLQHARAGLARAAPRVSDLDDVALGELHQEVGALRSALESIVGTLADREHVEGWDAGS